MRVVAALALAAAFVAALLAIGGGNERWGATGGVLFALAFVAFFAGFVVDDD